MTKSASKQDKNVPEEKSHDVSFEPIISIVGPTASGKSELAQQVAEQLSGHIVSADSMQIYKGMDIGTAKVLPENRRVPHHLIDVVDPGVAFSVQQYQFEARSVIKNLQQAGVPVVLCGGTGLYVQAALEDMRFPKGVFDSTLRKSYQDLLQNKGPDYLWELLKIKDPDSAKLIHPHNSRRVIRALEMNEQGVSYAQQSSHIKQLPSVIPSLRFGITCDPDVLRARIDARVDVMIEQGLVQEVNTLLHLGFADALTAKEAIGYKEIVSYTNGDCTLNDAIDQIKIATRRYAKRQRSWFRRDKSITWFDAQKVSTEDMANRIVESYALAVNDNVWVAQG